MCPRWWPGVAVSALASIDVVNRQWARATACGQVNRLAT